LTSPPSLLAQAGWTIVAVEQPGLETEAASSLTFLQPSWLGVEIGDGDPIHPLSFL
jgi:hypothetical protein